MRIGIFGGLAATATIDDIVADVCTPSLRTSPSVCIP